MVRLIWETKQSELKASYRGWAARIRDIYVMASAGQDKESGHAKELFRVKYLQFEFANDPTYRVT